MQLLLQSLFVLASMIQMIKKKVILANVVHSPGVIFSQQQYENFKLEFSGRCMLRGVRLSEVLI